MSELKSSDNLCIDKSNHCNETFNTGSTEFILIADHQTRQSHTSVQKQINERRCCKSYVKNIFCRKKIYRCLPILTWLPKYSLADVIGDFIAGITVGLTIMPQALAYAHVAGLPTQYGLYGAFMGCFVYVILGTCKDCTIGSTAIASLLTYQVAKGDWQQAVLLTFLTGCIEILMAIFQLGFLVDFVSESVSAGFISAVALIVTTSQMKYILGIKGEGTSFIQRWISMINDFNNIRPHDAILGSSCIAMLITLRWLGQLRIGPNKQQEQKWCHKIVNRIFWFTGIMRNASVIIACTILCIYWESQGKHYFKLTGYVPDGLPSFDIPLFSIRKYQNINSTSAEITDVSEVSSETFIDIIKNFNYGLIIIPMIALLENNSVCKTFSKGKPIDATQELFAIGVANVVNSFFQGYRINGGLARSSVNNASGVRTPLANFYVGVVVILSLLYLTKYFYYIPLSVLGAIIISAIIFQTKYHVVKPIWHSNRMDLLPGFVAFVACLLLPLEIGILIAIAVNLTFILYQVARPNLTFDVTENLHNQKFLRITPDRCLLFPAAEYVRNLILKTMNKTTTIPVIFDCTYVYKMDYTAAKVIASIVNDFNRKERKMIFFNVKPNVLTVLDKLILKPIVCYDIEALMKALVVNVNVNVNNGDSNIY